MSISFPSSSFRGLAVTTVALVAGDAEKCLVWLMFRDVGWRGGGKAWNDGVAAGFPIIKAGSRKSGINACVL